MKYQALSLSNSKLILVLSVVILLTGATPVFPLAPISVNKSTPSEILESNGIIFSRLNRNLPFPPTIDSQAINDIAQAYIRYMDSLIEKAIRERRSQVTFRILFHNDADGVGSAKIFQAFLNAYPVPAGITLIAVYEPRLASNYGPWIMDDIDAVVALDLYWSQMISGINMAVDHHVLAKSEEIYAESNQCLVNLKQMGIKAKSRYFPCVILTAILSDYILKVKKGPDKGLESLNLPIPVGLWVDVGVKGDFLFPMDEHDYVFRVGDPLMTSKVRYLCEIGSDVLVRVMNARTVQELDTLYEKYEGCRQKIGQIASSVQSQSDEHVIGVFVPQQEYLFTWKGDQVNLLSEMIHASCAVEISNGRPLADKRSVIIISYGTYQGFAVIRVNIRYNGDENRYDLIRMRECLTRAHPDKYIGSGNSIAMEFRFRLNGRVLQGESLTMLAQEIMSDFRKAIAEAKELNGILIFRAEEVFLASG
ncbi:MAG: hypothetical protein JW774_01375 [Candidatus Aureabacteria bacterium]|nr:hypothetical protein [Candidatus Auribacterota bacterium]